MALSMLLRCHDLGQTRQYYTDVLGFAASATAENTLTVELEDAGLIFTDQDLWHSAPTCSGTLYFTVADVDAYFASVKDKAALFWPLQDMPYGTREFAVTDCNGYLLAFQRGD